MIDVNLLKPAELKQSWEVFNDRHLKINDLVIEIKANRRRRKITMQADIYGNNYLCIHPSVTMGTIKQVCENHAQWFKKQNSSCIHSQSTHMRSQLEREYKTGDLVYLHGFPYLLDVRENSRIGTLVKHKPQQLFVVLVPHGTSRYANKLQLLRSLHYFPQDLLLRLPFLYQEEEQLKLLPPQSLVANEHFSLRYEEFKAGTSMLGNQYQEQSAYWDKCAATPKPWVLNLMLQNFGLACIRAIKEQDMVCSLALLKPEVYWSNVSCQFAHDMGTNDNNDVEKYSYGYNSYGWVSSEYREMYESYLRDGCSDSYQQYMEARNEHFASNQGPLTQYAIDHGADFYNSDMLHVYNIKSNITLNYQLIDLVLKPYNKATYGNAAKGMVLPQLGELNETAIVGDLIHGIVERYYKEHHLPWKAYWDRNELGLFSPKLPIYVEQELVQRGHILLEQVKQLREQGISLRDALALSDFTRVDRKPLHVDLSKLSFPRDILGWEDYMVRCMQTYRALSCNKHQLGVNALMHVINGEHPLDQPLCAEDMADYREITLVDIEGNEVDPSQALVAYMDEDGSTTEPNELLGEYYDKYVRAYGYQVPNRSVLRTISANNREEWGYLFSSTIVKSGVLQVYIRGKHSKNKVKTLLEAMYEDELTKLVTKLTEAYIDRLKEIRENSMFEFYPTADVSVKKIAVANIKNLGVYYKQRKELRISRCLAHYPVHVVAAVVAHEVGHILEFNHSKAFRKLVNMLSNYLSEDIIADMNLMGILKRDHNHVPTGDKKE